MPSVSPILSKIFSLTLLILLSFLSTTSLGLHLPQYPRPDISRMTNIVVEGNKNPEKVPEWIKWNCFFNRVLTLNTKGSDFLLRELNHLSPTSSVVTSKDLSSIIKHAQAAKLERTVLSSRFSDLASTNLLSRDIAITFDEQKENLLLVRRNSLAEDLSPEVFDLIREYVNVRVARQVIVAEFSRNK